MLKIISQKIGTNISQLYLVLSFHILISQHKIIFTRKVLPKYFFFNFLIQLIFYNFNTFYDANAIFFFNYDVLSYMSMCEYEKYENMCLYL